MDADTANADPANADTARDRVDLRLICLAAEATVVSLAVRLSLRQAGTGATLRRFQRFAVGSPGRDPRPGDARRSRQLQQIPRAVRAVGARRPTRFACLPRSITTWVMLRRRGISADVRVGVSGTSADFASHAWVELGGRPIGEDPHYVDSFCPLTIDSLVGGKQ